MANIPTPRSYSQILGDQVATFLSRSGIKSLKDGSPVLSILETSAQSDMRQSQDVFTMLKAIALDNAEGSALDRIGQDEQVPRLTKKPSSGFVNVSDTSFTKISSKVYQGLAAPIVGSTTIYIVDGSEFPASGSIYIGRGTSNYEGPLAYSAIAAVPNPSTPVYWTITLSAPTQRFHNLNEPVILAQGGPRQVTPSDVFQTPQGNISSAVQFNPIHTAVIPDGETQIESVQVICTQPGTIGNVSARTINQVSTSPFSGCAVINPLPFTNGLPDENDDDYRERIREARQTRTKGTVLAIETAVIGAVSPDENKSIISASVVTRTGFPTTLYIDDGTGYEEISEGVALETLEDLASGGEQFFEVASDRPVTKAYVQTTVAAPFVLEAGMTLTVKVGGVPTSHTFAASEFRAINNASAYEVVSAINADSVLGWSARTAASGTEVVVFAKEDTNEDVQVVPSDNDANDILLLPTTTAYTMMLYRNDRLLSKDGRAATIYTKPFSQWGAFTGDQTLQILVDGIQITDGSAGVGVVTFTAQDFADAATGYGTVGQNSLAAWAAVFNLRLPGITAVVSGSSIALTSNRGTSTAARVSVVGGSLVSNGMFAGTSAVGSNSDYVLDRNLGEIKLSSLLSANDKLTTGSRYTRAFLESSLLSTVNISSPANMWFSVDGGARGSAATLVPANTAALTVTGYADTYGYRLRVAALDGVSTLFKNVQTGDWSVFWDTNFNGDIRSQYRVGRVDSSFIFFDFDKMDMTMPVAGHTITALDAISGRFLITGGWTSKGKIGGPPWSSKPTAACMIYDSTSQTFIEAAPMSTARAQHQAVLMGNGKVLVTGGSSNGFDSGALATAEIYDPALNTWSAAASFSGTIPNGIWWHNSLLMGNGHVMITSGRTGTSSVNKIALQYNSGTDSWSTAGSMVIARSHAMAIKLGTNDIIVVGGQSTGAVLSSGEFYNSGANTWAALGTSLQNARQSGAIFLMNSGNVVIAGGSTTVDPASPVNSKKVDLYTTAGAGVAGALSANANEMSTPRSFMGYITTPAGRPVVIGGFRDDANKHGETGTTADNSSWTAAANNPSGLFTRAYCKLGNVGEFVFVTGGSREADSTTEPLGCSEKYDAVNRLFSQNDPSIGNVTPANGGLVFCRTPGLLQQVTVPIGTNYTATSLSALVAAGLLGATSAVYQTNKYRVSTNSFEVGEGDMGLVAADVAGQTLGQTVASSTVNLVGHLASVESGGSEYGTPDFHVSFVKGSNGGNAPNVLLDDNYNPTFTPGPQHILVGLQEIGPDTFTPRYGNNKFVHAPIASLTFDGSLAALTLEPPLPAASAVVAIGNLARAGGTTVTATTSAAHGFAVGQIVSMSPGEADFFAGDKVILTVPSSTTFTYTSTGTNATSTAQQTFTRTPSAARRWLCHSRAYFASTLQMGPRDDFSCLIDGDVNLKRFGMNMYRTVTTVGSTYALTNTFKDGDAGGASLAATFGLGYVFDDFAVYMPARTKTHDGDNTKRVLWRFNRLGPDGNKARLRYGLPDAPNAPVSVGVDNNSDDWTNLTVKLAGGAERTGYTVRTTTRVGVAATSETTGIATMKFIFGFDIASATRAGNIDDLTLTLPAGVTDHGIRPGDAIYINSTDINFSSGIKVVLTNTTTHITYAETAANAGPIASIGTLSFDSGDVTLAGASIAAGDFVRFSSTGTSFPSYITSTTMRITALSANNKVLSGGFDGFPPASINTVVQWNLLGGAPHMKIFQNPAQTVATIAGSVTSLGQLANATCPITGTASVGTGAGTVDRSSAEESGVYPTWFNLTDGVNYVGATTSPGSPAGDYTLTFKNPITSSLATNSDWANETVRIAPITVARAATWLNTPAVSGLFTSASPQLSNGATRVQISSLTAGTGGSVQVTGGTGNGATAVIMGTAVATSMDAPTSSGGGGMVRTSQIVVTVTTNQLHGLTVGSLVSMSPGEANFPAGIKTVASVVSPTQFTYNEYGTNTTNTFAMTFTPVANTIVTTTAAAAAGFVAGYRLAVNNTFPLPKVGVFTANTKLTSISIDGTFQFDSGFDKVWDFVASPSTNVMLLAESQSGYMAYTDSALGSPLVATNASEGDWVRITTPATPTGGYHQISQVNTGIFRIIRVVTSREGYVTFWVENKDASGTNVGLDDLPGECDVQFIKYGSVMPGDTIKISTDFWGLGNVGDWTVVDVGAGFTSGQQWKFKVDVTNRTVQVSGATAVLGAARAPLVQCIEAQPGRLFKRLISVVPNQQDGSLVDIKLAGSVGAGQISSAAGSILSALDKLAFSNDVATGIDGYRHSTGLVGIANKITWGDPSDTQTYPGVAAAGAVVNISGPIVKRISVSLIVRVRSGAPIEDVEAKIKSAVAAVINKAGVGEAISISDIVKAAGKVGGVTAVAIQSPTYGVGNDRISVQPYEKPRVLDLDADVLVSFVGQ